LRSLLLRTFFCGMSGDGCVFLPPPHLALSDRFRMSRRFFPSPLPIFLRSPPPPARPMFLDLRNRQSFFPCRWVQPGESSCALWSGAAEGTRTVPAGHGRPTGIPSTPQMFHQSRGERLKGNRSHCPPGVGCNNSSLEYDESPRFWSPFGNVYVGKTATEVVGGGRASLVDGASFYRPLLGSGAGSPQHKGYWRGCWLPQQGRNINDASTIDCSVSIRWVSILPIAPFPAQSNIFQLYPRTADGELGDTDAPCVIPFPSNFRLERTNFVTTPPSPGEILSVEALLDALRSALSGVGVDVLEFRPAYCVVS